MINLKIFIIEVPTKSDSAITNWPGKAYVNKLEAALCWILNPASFNKAPRAMKQAANGIAGLREPFRDCKPVRNTFKLIIHLGIIFLRLDF